MAEGKKEHIFFNSLNNDDFLFKNIIDNLDDLALILLDTDGNIITWNQGAERLTGYAEKEVIGQHFSIIYPKDSVESKYPDYVLNKVKEAGKFEHQAWRTRKDYSTFWANASVKSVTDKNGKVVGYSKIIQNLDEIKKTSLNIRRSEEQYKMLVKSVSDSAIFLLDSKGNVSTWNNGAENLLGYKKDEVMGKNFNIFYSDEDNESNLPQIILDKAENEGKYQFEAWRKIKDGSLFYAHTHINTIRDHSQKVIGFSNVTRNLTERKTAELNLWESEEKYRMLVDSVEDYAIILLDAEGKIRSWNAGAERLKGYSQEEIMGKHFSVFYPSETLKNQFPDFELEMARKDGKFEQEGWRVRKDGSLFWTNVIISPIYDEVGQILGFSKIARDLTSRKSIENELQEKNQELNKINSDLDNFIYSVSHDLKSPISNFEGLLDALSGNLSKECKEPVRKIFTYLDRSLKKLKEVVNDLSEVGRVQREDQSAIELVNVKIDELVDEFRITHQNQIEEANAVIKTELEFNEIKFSKKNLRGILNNLLANSLNYRSPDRPPEIIVKSYKVKDFFCLSISDNGLGIKKEHFSRIFEMFKRINTHVEGTGIGLYIVNRIVENVNGKIEIESELGKGTTFKIYLPLLN
ncbi:hypothetical protein BH23BAC1_BH23BAC1_17070 [soil metagenome]